jgi:hypothetical protein
MPHMPPTTPGLAALAFALVVHGELLVRLRQAEPAGPWWFGYARDGVNLAAALMLWGAYIMIGFSPPLGLMAGMLTCLATYLLDWLLMRGVQLKHSRALLAVPIAAWVTLVAIAPGRVAAAFDALLAHGVP